jgi:hypothetical protein
MSAHDSDSRSFRILRRDVRLDQLKLVCPVRDSGTQEVKEVVLDRMDLKKVLVYSPGKTADIEAGTKPLVTEDDELVQRESKEAYELEDYKWKTLRYIPETDTEILDHSEAYDEHDHDQEYGPEDTLLISVEEQTYWPEIVDHPMTSSVMKEISLKDSKSVTKFNEKIEESIREQAEAKMRKQFEREDRIRTPLQELKVELKRVEHEAVKARKADFDGRAGVEVAETPVRDRVESYEEAEEHEEPEIHRADQQKPQPVSDIMVAIGQAMARNWAKNPNVVFGNRKRLLEKVLECEGATPIPTPSTISTTEQEARV